MNVTSITILLHTLLLRCSTYLTNRFCEMHDTRSWNLSKFVEVSYGANTFTGIDYLFFSTLSS